MLYIYPYKVGSESVQLLKKELDIKSINLYNSKYRNKPRDWIINWGSTQCPYELNVLNHADAVQLACNKLLTFINLSDVVRTPNWQIIKELARTWLEQGHTVVGRATVTGYGGQGIYIFKTIEDLENCPEHIYLYTQYIPKCTEYRVHVFHNHIIDVQQKRQRRGAEVNKYIKNHSNGWVYCREDVVSPDEILSNSILAVKALGLDFGAVDILWDGEKSYVLEVNTAPGISGTTLRNYVNEFSNYKTR